jgi:uncharacterized membrane protein
MLAVTGYQWLVFGHVLAAMVWVGGAVLLDVLALQALRSGDSDVVTRFFATFRVIGPRVFGPSVVLLLTLGIWLVIDSDGWAFDQGWIRLGIGLVVAAFGVGGYVSRAAAVAERASARGDHVDMVRHLRRWSWGFQLVLLLLVVATWDMVTKPVL